MSKQKPSIQERLEKLGWTFNEEAEMGAQWTKTVDGAEYVIGQKTVDFAIDYAIAHSDAEMTSQRPSKNLHEISEGFENPSKPLVSSGQFIAADAHSPLPDDVAELLGQPKGQQGKGRGQFIAADTLPDENGQPKQRGQFIATNSLAGAPDDVVKLVRELQGQRTAPAESEPEDDPKWKSLGVDHVPSGEPEP